MQYIKHYSSPIGVLEIIANEDFLTHVLFREAQKKPSRQLEETLENSPIIDECIRQFEAYFDKQLRDFDLPLQTPGTDFQRNVWSFQKYLENLLYLYRSKELIFSKMCWNI